MTILTLLFILFIHILFFLISSIHILLLFEIMRARKNIMQRIYSQLGRQENVKNQIREKQHRRDTNNLSQEL